MKTDWLVKFVMMILFSFSPLFSDNFSNQLNHYHGNKITHFKVSGERCSGTNFTCSLIERNFPSLVNVRSKYGYKHFLCWFEQPYNQELMQKAPDENYFLTNTEQCLFVVIVRNVQDWLRSFYFMPWEIDPSMTENGFSHFLRAEWKIKPVKIGENKIFLFDTENPYTKRPFSNVLELRASKHRNFIFLSTKVKNYCLVRYEDVFADPAGFVQFLADFFGLPKNDQFISVDDYKGFNKRKYVPKAYFPISDEDQQFIDDTLDLSWEHLIGY